MLRNATPVLGLALLIGAGAVTPTFAATGSDFVAPPSVLAFDQKLQGDALVVDYVHLPATGYVAVYRLDEKGKPTGEPIGYTRIEKGDHRDLKIKMSETPKPGEKLSLALYKDGNDSEKFEPGNGDKSVWSKEALPHESRIIVR